MYNFFKSTIVIFFVLTLVKCNDVNKTNIVKSSTDISTIDFKDSSCKFSLFESKIMGIELSDSSSVLKLLESKIIPIKEWKNGNTNEDQERILYNEATDISLKLSACGGSFHNEFISIEMKKGKYESKSIRINNAVLVSGLGIKLGQTKTNVMQILGEPCDIEPKPLNNEVLYYGIDNTNSPFLKHYNQPSYGIECEFHKSILVRYNIGFPCE